MASIKLTILLILANYGLAYKPVVMYHGMGDTAYGSINQIKQYLEKELPGIYVTSIQMGDDVAQDLLSGYFMNLNTQVETACRIIGEDPKLKNGYNAIGFSQGGQILRAIAQRCPNPPMLNLISLGGQHQGVYGLPKCYGNAYAICDYIRKMINLGAYLPFVQEKIVQAEYWHDPLEEEMYAEKSAFIAEINNEKTKNSTYRENLLKLKNLVLVKFNNDSIVQPRESEWFEFYTPGQSETILPLAQSPIYTEDWIGLKELNNTNRLKLISTNGDHIRFTLAWFGENIVEPYLK